MKKMYLLYLTITIGIMAGAVTIARGNLLWFWDPPSFLLNPCLALIILLGHFSPREMLDAFKCAGTTERSESDLKKSLLFFESFHRLAIISGFIAFLMGLIMMLVMLDPSDQRKIGPFLAVAIISIFYSLGIIMLITVPFQSAIKKKLIK